MADLLDAKAAEAFRKTEMELQSFAAQIVCVHCGKHQL